MGCRPVLLLLCTLALVAAEDPAAKERFQWETGVEKIATTWETLIAQSQDAWWATVEPADERALVDLERLAAQAGRKGDQTLMVQAWTEVMYLDPEHDEAITFFETIGTLDDVEKALEERRVAAAASLTGAPEGSGDLPKAIDKILTTRETARDKASERYHDRLNDGREQAERDLKRHQDKQLRTIVSNAGRAQRRGDVVTTAALWKLALQIDPAHPEAVAFFTALDTLDKVRAELGEPEAVLVAVPPLEEEPGTGGQALADVDGLAVLVIGYVNPVGIELLEEAGAEVDERALEKIKNPRAFRRTVSDVIDGDFDVIIVGAIGGPRFTGLAGARVLADANVPVVLASDHGSNVQALKEAGAIPRKAARKLARIASAVPTDHPVGRSLGGKARFDFAETAVQTADAYPEGLIPVVVGEPDGYPFVFAMEQAPGRAKLIAFGLPTDVEEDQAEALEALWVNSVAWAAGGH